MDVLRDVGGDHVPVMYSLTFALLPVETEGASHGCTLGCRR
jgi:hypothetical protein